MRRRRMRRMRRSKRKKRDGGGYMYIGFNC